MLSNNLVCYYKTKLVKKYSSVTISDKKLLSQIALNNIFEEFLDVHNTKEIESAMNQDEFYDRIDKEDARF